MKNNLLKLLFLLFLLISCGGGHQTGRPMRPFNLPLQPQVQIKKAHQFTSTLPDPTHFVEYKLVGKSLFVSGKDLVIKEGESKLTKALSENEFERLVFHLDQLIIETPLVLTGKQVEIRVRKLEFKAQGAIDVSGSSASQLGEDGGDAGDILLDAQQIIDQSPFHLKRFVLNGGKGGDAAKGRVGRNGTSVPTVKGNIVYQEELRQFCQTPEIGLPHMKSSRGRHCRWDIEKKRGQEKCPTSGENAVQSGRAGSGGRSGQFKTIVALDLKTASLISDTNGESGKSGKDYKGGKAGLPLSAVFVYQRRYANGKVKKETKSCTPSVNGTDAIAPSMLLKAEDETQKNLQFHSTLERMKVVLKYAETLWAKGYKLEAQKELDWIELGLERNKLKTGRDVTLLALLETRFSLLKVRMNYDDRSHNVEVENLEEKLLQYFGQNIDVNNYLELGRNVNSNMMREIQAEIKEGDEISFSEFMYTRAILHQTLKKDVAQMNEHSLKKEDIEKLNFYLLQNDIDLYFYQIAYDGLDNAHSWFYHRLYLDMITSVREKVIVSTSSREILASFDKKLMQVVEELKGAAEVSRLTIESLAAELYQL